MSAALTRRLSLSLALAVGLAACGGGGSDSGTPANVDPQGWNAVTTLKTTDTAVGTGASADVGKTATVTYAGYLYDVRVADTRGTRFDAGSFQFTLGTVGTGGAIKGFDQGVTGMKVGGKRTITIPASLGYGATGAGASIPPNAALVFDVELTAVR
jgi:FKBP-type peptidyl-prolyl cis-trans isomerase FkpA